MGGRGRGADLCCAVGSNASMIQIQEHRLIFNRWSVGGGSWPCCSTRHSRVEHCLGPRRPALLPVTRPPSLAAALRACTCPALTRSAMRAGARAADARAAKDALWGGGAARVRGNQPGSWRRSAIWTHAGTHACLHAEPPAARSVGTRAAAASAAPGVGGKRVVYPPAAARLQCASQPHGTCLAHYRALPRFRFPLVHPCAAAGITARHRLWSDS